jgi:hypothetical protein
MSQVATIFADDFLEDGEVDDHRWTCDGVREASHPSEWGRRRRRIRGDLEVVYLGYVPRR